MRWPIKRMIAVAVCVVLGATQAAVARYNPNQGRWTTRDPAGIAQKAPPADGARQYGFLSHSGSPQIQYGDGPNLYEYARGQPLRRIDPAGKRSASFYFYAADLGRRDPEPYYRWFVRRGSVMGVTRLKQWSARVSLVPCKSRGFKVEATGGRGEVEYWWSTPSSRSHELVHVGIYKKNYFAMVQQIRGLEGKGCMCSRRRAGCYAGLTGKFSSYYLALAGAEHKEFDCREYGQDFPEACRAARKARERARKKASGLTKAIHHCQSMED